MMKNALIYKKMNYDKKKEEREMPVIHIYIPQYAHNIYLYKENIYIFWNAIKT